VRSSAGYPLNFPFYVVFGDLQLPIVRYFFPPPFLPPPLLFFFVQEAWLLPSCGPRGHRSLVTFLHFSCSYSLFSAAVGNNARLFCFSPFPNSSLSRLYSDIEHAIGGAPLFYSSSREARLDRLLFRVCTFSWHAMRRFVSFFSLVCMLLISRRLFRFFFL